MGGAAALLWGRDVTGSVLFCLALNFKQMALYYAPVFFCVLLRRCDGTHSVQIRRKTTTPSPQHPYVRPTRPGSRCLVLPGASGLTKLAKFGALAAAVLGTFGLLWAPFAVLRGPGVDVAAALLAVLTRLFPFGRGLFEDKVPPYLNKPLGKASFSSIGL